MALTIASVGGGACSSAKPASPAVLLQQISSTLGAKPGVVLRDSDIGRAMSVRRGVVIEIDLAKSTSAPRWGVPAYGEDGVLVTIGYRNPNHGPFVALLRAVGDGTTEVVVATECERVGAMCSGWTANVSVTG